MSRRPRVNPHDRGSPEHLLFQRWKATTARAATLDREAQRLRVEADAEQAKADHYAKALVALGAAVPAQRLLEGPQT